MPPKKDASKATADVSLPQLLEKEGFTEATVTILKDNGFNTVDSLSLLAVETSAITDLKLTLQQGLLLKRFVIQHAPDDTTAPAISGKAPQSAVGTASVTGTLDKVMSDLLGEKPDTTQQFPGSLSDPQVYLKGGSASKSKHLDIVNFIHLVTPLVEEQVLCNENGVEMLFRTGNKTPSLEVVSTEEWCLANARIMNELLDCGLLGVAGIKDYLSYTVKMCDLFMHFDHVSVLKYDREYRHLQSLYSFRWGTDTPHLYNTCLRPKPLRSATNHDTGRGARKHPVEVCRLFNSNKGCHYGDRCKFVHRCSEPGCRQSHSRATAHVQAPLAAPRPATGLTVTSNM